MKRAIFVMTALLLMGARSAFAQEALQEIIVGPGETVWSIAQKYLKDPHRWPEIAQYNKLPSGDPTLALPGQRIRIPVMLIKEEFRTAQLIELVPEVRYKRKIESDWKTASKDMNLNYEDSLRTMNGGQARVKFPTKEIVQINENSYVILKPEKIMQEIELMHGDIRASRSKVIMPQGTVVLPKAGSDYQARVRDDATEVVFVYKGKVDVTAQGRTVTVPEGFGTQVPKSSPPMAPQPLHFFKDFDPSVIKSATVPPPTVSQTGNVKITPPTVIREERPNEKQARSVLSEKILSSYRLQIARDDSFRAIVLEKVVPLKSSFDIKQEAIPDGFYKMRVAFIDALGVQGAFSPPTDVTKDTVPPKLSNITPEDGATYDEGDTSVDVAGIAEGATLLAINNEVVFVSPEGKFSKWVPLSAGANKIRIVARDAQGNQTEVVRKVTYGRSKNAGQR